MPLCCYLQDLLPWIHLWKNIPSRVYEWSHVSTRWWWLLSSSSPVKGKINSFLLTLNRKPAPLSFQTISIHIFYFLLNSPRLFSASLDLQMLRRANVQFANISVLQQTHPAIKSDLSQLSLLSPSRFHDYVLCREWLLCLFCKKIWKGRGKNAYLFIYSFKGKGSLYQSCILSQESGMSLLVLLIVELLHLNKDCIVATLFFLPKK